MGGGAREGSLESHMGMDLSLEVRDCSLILLGDTLFRMVWGIWKSSDMKSGEEYLC